MKRLINLLTIVTCLSTSVLFGCSYINDSGRKLVPDDVYLDDYCFAFAPVLRSYKENELFRIGIDLGVFQIHQSSKCILTLSINSNEIIVGTIDDIFSKEYQSEIVTDWMIVRFGEYTYSTVHFSYDLSEFISSSLFEENKKIDFCFSESFYIGDELVDAICSHKTINEYNDTIRFNPFQNMSSCKLHYDKM